MGNFIGLAFSTLKKAGIDTKNMSIKKLSKRIMESILNRKNKVKPARKKMKANH